MSTTNAKVQVFVPVYNDREFLPHAISSVLGQLGADMEVIVSDNASTDGTTEYLSELAARNPRVVVHRNSENIGMLANLNRFRELVTADRYMLLCSDDMLGSPHALRHANEILDANADVVTVYCDLLYIDGHGRALANRRFGRSGRFNAGRTLRQSIMSGRNLFGIPLIHRRQAGASTSYPAELTYTGDVYHSARCAEHGSVFHIPEVLIHNRYTGRNATAGVYTESVEQFDATARSFGIKLTGAERALQRLQINQTLVSKALFLRYAKWRSRAI
jgi:glycosyltransferase involved in cell wall biosynthesis